MPFFAPFQDGIILSGSTSSSADTALATLPVNPHKRADVYCIPISGAGVYIEDDGLSATNVSGITATTIDVRSTNASAEPFKVAVIVREETVRTQT